MTKVTVSLETKDEDAVAKMQDIKEVKLEPRSEERTQARGLMIASWGEERFSQRTEIEESYRTSGKMLREKSDWWRRKEDHNK